MENVARLKIVFIISVLLLFIIGCYSYIYLNLRYAYPEGMNRTRISSESGASFYDPDTVLLQIRNNDPDAFIETDLPPSFPAPEDYLNANPFTEDELLEIVNYYLHSNWGEDPDDWTNNRVVYTLYDCGNGLNGPFTVGFHFQKMVTVDGEKYRDDRGIRIDTWSNMVVWNDRVENGHPLTTSIKWKKITYNAYDVFRIAEDNGGYQIYSESENHCGYTYIDHWGFEDSWEVSYNSPFTNDLLDIEIDEKSGEVINITVYEQN